MRILIKQATIIDPASPHHGKRMDIFVSNGKIEDIRKTVKPSGSYQEIRSPSLHISPGWLDIGAQLGEPGHEHRETLESGAAAAMRGGFTAVACFPNTSPPLHSKSEITYILKKSKDLPVDIVPIGALSRDCNGEEMAEMLDMYAAGAVAFSDGERAVSHPGLFLRALLYAKGMNGLIIQTAFDKSIMPAGLMHEGKMSTKLGLKGIPVLSETLMIMRDLRILEYTGSRLLVHGVSSRESVHLISEAKRQGLDISCSVPALNLLLDDRVLENYDERYKVLPPLRSSQDRKSLIQGLKDDVIDCIVSQHVPRDVEEKHREFAQSAFGSIGLETAFAIANTAIGDQMELAQLVDKLCQRPRNLLSLPVPLTAKGEKANITLFDPSVEWTVSSEEHASLSGNDAVVNESLKGRVIGVITKGKSHMFTQA